MHLCLQSHCSVLKNPDCLMSPVLVDTSQTTAVLKWSTKVGTLTVAALFCRRRRAKRRRRKKRKRRAAESLMLHHLMTAHLSEIMQKESQGRCCKTVSTDGAKKADKEGNQDPPRDLCTEISTEMSHVSIETKCAIEILTGMQIADIILTEVEVTGDMSEIGIEDCHLNDLHLAD